MGTPILYPTKSHVVTVLTLKSDTLTPMTSRKYYEGRNGKCLIETKNGKIFSEGSTNILNQAMTYKIKLQKRYDR
jgi:hypothetical protein